MTKPLCLLIPAAGRGSRFSDVGINVPKPLIPVLKIPMLLWVIANFSLNPEEKVVVLCQASHRIPTLLRPFLENLKLEIDFIEIDYWTEGPAHSLEILLEHTPSDAPVICANSDQFVFQGLDGFTDAVRHGGSEGQILTMKASSNAWSYVGRDSVGKINRVVEKVEISNEATVGVYGWRSARICREALTWQRVQKQKTNNEFYVAPSYQHLIENYLNISTHSVGRHGEGVHGLGTPKDLKHFITLDIAWKMRKVILDRLGLQDLSVQAKNE